MEAGHSTSEASLRIWSRDSGCCLPGMLEQSMDANGRTQRFGLGPVPV